MPPDLLSRTFRETLLCDLSIPSTEANILMIPGAGFGRSIAFSAVLLSGEQEESINMKERKKKYLYFTCSPLFLGKISNKTNYRKRIIFLLNFLIPY